MKLFKYCLLLMLTLLFSACGGGSDANPPADTTPDTFSFETQYNVALDSLIESNPVTVSGINSDVEISISGGEYAVDGGSYTSQTGTVQSGHQVSVRLQSSPNFNTEVSAVLNIGTSSESFSVRTLLETPDTESPFVTSSSPANGETDVDLYVTPSVTFNEDILPTSINSNSVKAYCRNKSGSSYNEIPGDIDFDTSSNILTFTPASSLHVIDDCYLNLATDITDLSGNTLTGRRNIYFSTRDGKWDVSKITGVNLASTRPADITLADKGDTLLLWNDDANILTQRYQTKTGWSHSETIGANVNSYRYAIVRFNTNGQGIAAWVKQVAGTSGVMNGQVVVRIYSNGVWGPEKVISDLPSSAFLPRVAIDPEGNALVAWIQPPDSSAGGMWGNNNVWAKYYHNTLGWRVAYRVDFDGYATEYYNPTTLNVALNDNGDGLVSWRETYYSEQTGHNNRFWVRPFEKAPTSNATARNGGWAAYRTIQYYSANQVSLPILATSKNKIIVAWNEETDYRRVELFTRVFEPGIGWSEHTSYSTTTNIHRPPNLIANKAGDVMLAWYEANDLRTLSSYALKAIIFDEQREAWGNINTLMQGDFYEDLVIGLDEKGNGIILYLDYDNQIDEAKIQTLRYIKQQSMWKELTSIVFSHQRSANTTQPFIFHKVVIAPNGTAILVWNNILRPDPERVSYEMWSIPFN